MGNKGALLQRRDLQLKNNRILSYWKTTTTTTWVKIEAAGTADVPQLTEFRPHLTSADSA